MASRALALVMLGGCMVSAPNTWVPFAPVATAPAGPADRAAVTQRAIFAIGELGLGLAVEDAVAGAVISDWFSPVGSQFGDLDLSARARFRYRIAIEPDGRFTIDVQCQSRRSRGGLSHSCEEHAADTLRFAAQNVTWLAARMGSER